ncbi:hypothetical protein T484DRAFT_3639621 [Baffinella frigidus]|nr:hypothetical protein T484DRAFT_3639621 [Cryptophyta sp. CCMP2293]
MSGAQRSALIVAVSEHTSKNVPKLARTTIDVEKLKGALLELGWTVEMAVDFGLKQTKKKIKEFAFCRAKYSGGDCLFAFVGHGVELNGRKYLVAADSEFDLTYESEATFEKTVKRGCLPFDEVQGEFKNARGSSAGVMYPESDPSAPILL